MWQRSLRGMRGLPPAFNHNILLMLPIQLQRRFTAPIYVILEKKIIIIFTMSPKNFVYEKASPYDSLGKRTFRPCQLLR